MWRDYESEQGEAIETFPGFRRLVRDLGAVHGLFAYRAKSGEEYLIVHAGKRLYSFESEAIAVMDDVNLTEKAALDKVELEDGDSQGFIFNNNLYILDGKHFVVVSSVTDQSGATSVTASEIDAYVPTTYFDGKPLEQRNMLVDEAYEKVSKTMYEDKNRNSFAFINYEFTDTYWMEVYGFADGFGTPYVTLVENSYGSTQPPATIRFGKNSFSDTDVKEICIMVKNTAHFASGCFKNCLNLEKVTILYRNHDVDIHFNFSADADSFESCPKLKQIEIVNEKYTQEESEDHIASLPQNQSSPIKNYSGKPIVIIKAESDEDLLSLRPPMELKKRISITELAKSVSLIKNEQKGNDVHCGYSLKKETFNGQTIERVEYIYMAEKDLKYTDEDDESSEATEYLGDVKISLQLHPLHFSTIENVKNFHEGNPDYEGTGIEAINGCTKSAVFDGRIFLTGNPALPNTVFYSNRNLTGANDPTYFGAYNYFNDGDGNTPNVDLLSTPSMLMVLKNSTVQDGSVYYHTPAYNEDEYSRDLVPRIYPSTSGAAGLGSSGRTVPGTTACNFLDDPVFLSVRGLESVGKQLVNAERNLTHRSSNVDRFLIKEDLSRASIAEWKGYLVICCDGRFYLADSRQMHQHPDGSYQYEWYYLEGLGCWDEYSGGYRYINDWFEIDDNGNTLEQCTLVDGRLIGEAFATSDGVFVGDTGDITVYSAQKPDGSQFYFYAHGNLALETVDEERCGVGEFYPARKIVVVGERLFFGTADGDVCVINTDKRGVPDYKDQDFESDRISSRWYSFAGVRYPSICVTRLDDCSKKSLAKGTVPGATVARFKMMPGSHLRANVSLNGRDFKKIGEAFASRYDAGDLRFDNFSFTENEDAIVVLRELTRNWVDKQYSFVSDGFREPFGLYEISYLYTVKGKIRKTFALVERK
jgi:hypothetical protein